MTSEISDSPYGRLENYEQMGPRIQPCECVTNCEYDYIFADNDLQPRPPTFDGKPDTWEPFLMQFRIFAKSYS